LKAQRARLATLAVIGLAENSAWVLVAVTVHGNSFDTTVLHEGEPSRALLGEQRRLAGAELAREHALALWELGEGVKGRWRTAFLCSREAAKRHVSVELNVVRLDSSRTFLRHGMDALYVVEGGAVLLHGEGGLG